MTENALPVAAPAAEAGAQTSPAENVSAAPEATEGHQADKPEGDKPAGEKREKTAEEREIARLRRRVDNLTRQRYELQARTQQQTIAPNHIDSDNVSAQDDSETLSLSRRELQQLIDQRAREVAPTITQQQAEIEHRRSVVSRLAQEFGERFDAVAADLDDALGGLADRSGQPKPVADAIFSSDMPRELIEYLSDPDNADEASAIGRMSAAQAGRAIAKLETKLQQKKAEATPQPSKVAAPVEPVKGNGGGVSTKRLADLTDAQFNERRRQQIAARR